MYYNILATNVLHSRFLRVGTKKPAREERAGKAPADYVWTKPDASVTLGHQCLCYYMPLLNDTQIYELCGQLFKHPVFELNYRILMVIIK